MKLELPMVERTMPNEPGYYIVEYKASGNRMIVQVMFSMEHNCLVILRPGSSNAFIPGEKSLNLLWSEKIEI